MLDKNEFCNLNISNFEEFESLLYTPDSELFRVDKFCAEDLSLDDEKRLHKRIAALRVVYNGHHAASIFIANGRGRRLLKAINNHGRWVVYIGTAETPLYDHLSYSNLVLEVRQILTGSIVLYSGKNTRFFLQSKLDIVAKSFYQIEEFLRNIHGDKVPPMYVEYLRFRFSHKFPRDLDPQSMVLLYRAVLCKFDFELFYKAVLV